MRNNNRPFAEIFGMLPKLVLIVLLSGATAAGASQLVNEPDPVVTAMVDGGSITKPSGVGFVLAMTLQRNGAALR
jgi:hypothetical protein